MSLVIVAIPEEQDRVWKISSEKVPHLTLLYLGDEAEADTQQIVQFVEHAVTLSEHGPFYLDVDSRGELGEAKADVLFFSKRSWNLKWIKQFRGQLLQNQSVRTAFDGSEQHQTAPQEWLPHLTLGYPETPAKADPNDEPFGHPIYSVCFDRIAVWDTDFSGPEFKLEWPDREFEGDLAVAWADEQKKALTHQLAHGSIDPPKETDKEADKESEEGPQEMEHTALKGADFVSFLVHGIPEDGEAFILEHYGVKGMRWGQRTRSDGSVREGGPIARRNTARKEVLADRKARGVPAKGTIRGKSKTPPEAVAPKATSKVPAGTRRKTKVEVEGGQNHPAHEDAIKVAESKAKLKKSGPAALSNKELQDLQTRLNLERNVEGLVGNQNRIARGRAFVRRATGNVQEVNNTVNTGLQSARLADQLRGNR